VVGLDIDVDYSRKRDKKQDGEEEGGCSQEPGKKTGAGGGRIVCGCGTFATTTLLEFPRDRKIHANDEQAEYAHKDDYPQSPNACDAIYVVEVQNERRAYACDGIGGHAQGKERPCETAKDERKRSGTKNNYEIFIKKLLELGHICYRRNNAAASSGAVVLM